MNTSDNLDSLLRELQSGSLNPNHEFTQRNQNNRTDVPENFVSDDYGTW